MNRTYWIYRNIDCGFNLEKIPIYLERISEDGNFEKGHVFFQSTAQIDEVWGSDVKFEISWEKTDRMTYRHGKKVNKSIEMYNAVNVVTRKKQTEWVYSHEMTNWYGTRNQIKKKRFYATNIIHSIMFCDQTSRLFETHSTIISSIFPNYEPLILDAIRSIKCHGI